MGSTDEKIADYQRAVRSVIGMLEEGIKLTGSQENMLVDTMHDLQVSYNTWLTRTPIKDQSYVADDER